MNYCRRCESDYEKPGTCNCFAPQASQPAVIWPQWTDYHQCPQCGQWYTGSHLCYATVTTRTVPDPTIRVWLGTSPS